MYRSVRLHILHGEYFTPCVCTPFEFTLANDRYFPPPLDRMQTPLFLRIFHTPFSLPPHTFPIPSSTLLVLVHRVGPRLRVFLSFHTCSAGISGPGGRICKLNGINERSEKIFSVCPFLLFGNFEIFKGMGGCWKTVGILFFSIA